MNKCYATLLYESADILMKVKQTISNDGKQKLGFATSG